LVDGDEQGSASLFSQLVLVGYFCVFGELTRVRDCFLLAGVAATTSLVTSADFDTERDLRSRVGVGSEPWATPRGLGADVGVTAGATCAADLRPNPSSFAIIERRSE
jgi:hypothetical protein